MNIDPDKVKKLVLIFSELNEEYQNKLMREALRLKFEHNELLRIQEEKLKFTTDKELQDEINKRTYNLTKEIITLLDVYNNVDDIHKAALLLLANRLAGQANAVEETDITITVNKKEISMKDYLEKHISSVDYEEVNNLVNDILK